MSKIKIIIIIFLLSVIACVYVVMIYPAQQRKAYDQKIVLAKEIQKVMSSLMLDLRLASESSIKDVPSDGQWHKRMAFNISSQGAVEYSIDNGHLIRSNKQQKREIAQHIKSLGVRRYQQAPNILEVRIKAKEESSLESNFKIRLGH